MRLRSEIWVKAYLRRVAVQGAAAYVMRRGDPDAGAIFICISSDAGADLWAPALALDPAGDGRRWQSRTGPSPVSREQIAEVLAREASTDPDIWVVEVEDRGGRHFLDCASEMGGSSA